VQLGLLLLAGQFPGMSDGRALAGALDAALAAEGAGPESVWFAEHHFITYGVWSLHGTRAWIPTGPGPAGEPERPVA